VKLADIVDQLEIDVRKLLKYALSPDADEGKHKAVLFKSVLGFTPENYQALLIQIEANCLLIDVIVRSENQYGQRYQVDVLIEGTNGNQAWVRTGWIVARGLRVARLTSLYIVRR